MHSLFGVSERQISISLFWVPFSIPTLRVQVVGWYLAHVFGLFWAILSNPLNRDYALSLAIVSPHKYSPTSACLNKF